MAILRIRAKGVGIGTDMTETSQGHFLTRFRLLQIIVLCAFGSVLGTVTGSAGTNEDLNELLDQVQFSLVDAVNMVQSSFDGYVIGVELEEEDGMFYYEVELVSEVGRARVYVNPANGIVIGIDQEEGIAIRFQRRWQRRLAAAQASKLTIVEAIRVAQEKADGHVVEVDLKTRSEPTVYEIKLLNGDQESEVSVATNDGSITDFDVDD
ncbi:MAG: hypothetical protein E2O89_08435 [Alphaproteobacteria bacterium]|nr:MAG: hypothetical protein E2O89_08435 [Alphaproteobacteria bacterium]